MYMVGGLVGLAYFLRRILTLIVSLAKLQQLHITSALRVYGSCTVIPVICEIQGDVCAVQSARV